MNLIKYIISSISILLTCVIAIIDISRFKLRKIKYESKCDYFISYLKEIKNYELLELVEEHKNIYSRHNDLKRFINEIEKADSELKKRLRTYYDNFYNINKKLFFFYIRLALYFIYIYGFLYVIQNREIGNLDFIEILIGLVIFGFICLVLSCMFFKLVMKKYDISNKGCREESI